MKRIILPAFAVLGTAAAMAQTVPVAEYPGYKLAFNEEFDEGDAPDPDRWTFESGFCRNHEDQIYCRENATCQDGMLIIEARKEQTLNPNYERYSSDWKKQDKYGDYSSASIILKDPYRYHYGVYEVRAKIPVGTGYWPAIWGCGNKFEWPYNGELDIMEYYGNAIHANLAWGSMTRWNAHWASAAPKMNEFEGDFADNFHTWLTEWDHNSVRIYLDGRLLNEVDLDRTVNDNPGQSWYNKEGYNPYRDPDNTFGVWLNLALGGDNGGSLANTPFPAQYLVDYVRVYVPETTAAPLHLRVSRAQALLDETQEGNNPMQFPAEARLALRQVIADAEALYDSEDEEAIDAAMDALQAAMDTYRDSFVNPCVAGGTYTFIHTDSGCVLSTGWMDDKECVLLTDAGQEGYGQALTLEPAPDGADVSGYNLRTADGKYVYRDSWNLWVGDGTGHLREKNWIFDVEKADGKLVIKSFGTNKYFGTDSSSAWSHVYSDKPGKGNRRAWFEIAGMHNSVGMLAAAGGERAVYNLQGIKVADCLADMTRHDGEVLIVVEDGTARKVVR